MSGLPTLFELALVVASLFPSSPDAARDAFVPPPDPGPNAACPGDMRLVVGRHYADVEHLCVEFRASIKRCWAYYPDFTLARGGADARFCMDQFEAPNVRGADPLVMATFPEASAWCVAHGKRICAEAEWETACESGDERPFLWGWRVAADVCNTDKPWLAFDEAALMAGGEGAARETKRLWQGSPSGEYASCRTKDGIYDLLGNVEEWVSSSRARRYPEGIMGGFWAKPWVGCRGTNDAHEPNFRFYEVGFRCCSEAS